MEKIIQAKFWQVGQTKTKLESCTGGEYMRTIEYIDKNDAQQKIGELLEKHNIQERTLLLNITKKQSHPDKVEDDTLQYVAINAHIKNLNELAEIIASYLPVKLTIINQEVMLKEKGEETYYPTLVEISDKVQLI